MQGIWKKALAFICFFGVVGIASLLVNLDPNLVRAQEAKGNLPQLGDLMNNAMQIHHTKLWFAGHVNNWALAKYELRKIKETIEEVKEDIVAIQTRSPQWRHVSINEMLKSFDSSLKTLDQAVKTKDANRFDTNYRELTAACNACHVSIGQPQIKIVEPLSNGSFADQDFTADGGQ